MTAALPAIAAAAPAVCAYTAGPAVVSVPGRPFSAEPSPDGCASARAIVRVKVGTSPVGVAVTPDGRWAWVSASDRFGGGRAALTAVNLSGPQPAVGASVPAEGFPRDLRLLPDGETLAAALYTRRAVRLLPATPAPATP